MRVKNTIRLEIYKQEYKSVRAFCAKHDLNYRRINKLANNETGSFHMETIVKVCSALNKDVGDLFFIEKEKETA